MKLSEIFTATFLADQKKIKRNLQAMQMKAAHYGLQFRPHFKTHQSHWTGRLFREAGTEKITVSSMEMAEFFISDGWKDICIAFPFNTRETDRLNRIPAGIALSLCFEDAASIAYVDSRINRRHKVYLKADAGYGRTGLPADLPEAFSDCVHALDKAQHLSFYGFLAHNGHSYSAKGQQQVCCMHQEAKAKLLKLKQAYKASKPFLSIGDTPSCSLCDDFSGIDEIRPGNFVYYDLMQWQIGACQLEDIAVCLAVPVVANHPQRNETVVHAGAVHLSNEALDYQGKNIFGLAVPLQESGHWSITEQLYPVVRLSQEHGIIHGIQAKPGDMLGILPVHSCLTAGLMRNNTIVLPPKKY